MSFQSKAASRGGVKPIISIYSESGSGKSMSALLLARGLVGPKGNIQQIDTEAGRGELYSDVIPGGYNTIPFTEPFSPARYVEAVRFAEAQKANVIIIDQMSSEWDGISGVLDMAGENESAGKKGLSVWKTPKMEHAKMLVRLLQSPCPIIICLRAKYKSRQVKVSGRTEIIKDDHITAIQDENFIFESTCHGWVDQDHRFHLTKASHPGLTTCFPKNGMITTNNGELLKQWCNAPSKSPTVTAKKEEPTAPTANIVSLKKILWDITKERHPDGSVAALEQWLWDENYIDTDKEDLAGLDVKRLEEVIEKIQNKGK